MKNITIKQLARELNLSVSTVSRALANDKNIRRETKEIVLKLASQYNYRRNPVAVNLQSGRTHTIGVIVPEMVTPFAASVIQGIQSVLYAHNLKVIITQSNEDPNTESENIRLMEQFMVDGIIACPCDVSRNGEEYARLNNMGIPVVFFDRVSPNNEFAKVIVDDRSNAYFITEHLIGQGCRRIVHLAGPSSIPNAPERLNGYRYALEKFGILFDKQWIIPAGVTFDDGRDAADELLRRDIAPDALFAWTDTQAIGAMHRLIEQGVRVPQDIAIAGFSGTVLSTIVTPQLTTIEQPLYEMGQQTATLILEKLDNPLIQNKTVTLKAVLKRRESTNR